MGYVIYAKLHVPKEKYVEKRFNVWDRAVYQNREDAKSGMSALQRTYGKKNKDRYYTFKIVKVGSSVQRSRQPRGLLDLSQYM